MAVWTMDIPTIVFARIVSEFSEDLKKQLGMQKVTVNGLTTWLNFSSSQVSETPPRFPYVTVIELPGDERGQDLEGTSINGGLFTFQVDAFSNKNESEAKKCIDEVMRVMLTMRFRPKPMPSPDSKPQEYRMTARFSRTIGAGDIL